MDGDCYGRSGSSSRRHVRDNRSIWILLETVQMAHTAQSESFQQTFGPLSGKGVQVARCQHIRFC